MVLYWCWVCVCVFQCWRATVFSALISSTLLLGAISRISMKFWGFLGLPLRKRLRKPTTRFDNPYGICFTWHLFHFSKDGSHESLTWVFSHSWPRNTIQTPTQMTLKLKRSLPSWQKPMRWGKCNVHFSSKCLALH